jgi:hypothetical protein
VTWLVDEDQGRATPISIELRSPHGEPVTAEAWRSVRVAEVIEATRKELRDLLGVQIAVDEALVAVGGDPGPRLASSQARARALEDQPRRPGRPRTWDDEHYRRVAEVYLTALADHDPRPVRAVAKAFGIRNRKDTRAKAWVRDARQRGFIPTNPRKD